MLPGDTDSNGGVELRPSNSEPTHSCAGDRPLPSEGNKEQVKALTWDCRGRIYSSIDVEAVAVELRQGADGVLLRF